MTVWVRIDELSFPPGNAEALVCHVRDTAAVRFGGDGFTGFRLLVDRPNGRALEVSYWTDGSTDARQAGSSGHPPGTTVIRTDYYELAVDSTG